MTILQNIKCIIHNISSSKSFFIKKSWLYIFLEFCILSYIVLLYNNFFLFILSIFFLSQLVVFFIELLDCLYYNFKNFISNRLISLFRKIIFRFLFFSFCLIIIIAIILRSCFLFFIIIKKVFVIFVFFFLQRK